VFLLDILVHSSDDGEKHAVAAYLAVLICRSLADVLDFRGKHRGRIDGTYSSIQRCDPDYESAAEKWEDAVVRIRPVWDGEVMCGLVVNSCPGKGVWMKCDEAWIGGLFREESWAVSKLSKPPRVSWASSPTFGAHGAQENEPFKERVEPLREPRDLLREKVKIPTAGMHVIRQKLENAKEGTYEQVPGGIEGWRRGAAFEYANPPTQPVSRYTMHRQRPKFDYRESCARAEDKDGGEEGGVKENGCFRDANDTEDSSEEDYGYGSEEEGLVGSDEEEELASSRERSADSDDQGEEQASRSSRGSSWKVPDLEHAREPATGCEDEATFEIPEYECRNE
jgi:hypothetical protein